MKTIREEFADLSFRVKMMLNGWNLDRDVKVKYLQVGVMCHSSFVIGMSLTSFVAGPPPAFIVFEAFAILTLLLNLWYMVRETRKLERLDAMVDGLNPSR